ncbi:MAG: hypothetical protein IJP17_01545 [Clostridia bacterium]|nr:hypothetical protein [Clostridia bacterium]
MERPAFLYKGEYYLLPDGYSAVDEFCREIAQFISEVSDDGDDSNNAIEVYVEHLAIKKSLPPYFVDSNIERQTLAIDTPELIYPTQVHILSREEYDARLLEMVKERCVGCARYGDDGDDSLDGHHEEMTIDGVCFTRREEGEESYNLLGGLNYCFKLFCDKKDELESLIDAGKLGDASNEIAEILSHMMPPLPVVLTAKLGGRYICCFSGVLNNMMSIVLGYLCDQLNRRDIGGWLFIPYIPEGFASLCEREFIAPEINYQVRVEARRYINLQIFSPGEDFGDFVPRFIALCDAIGENVLANSAVGIEWVNEPLSETHDIAELKRDANDIVSPALSSGIDLFVPPIVHFNQYDGDKNLVCMAATKYDYMTSLLSSNPELLFGGVRMLRPLNIWVGELFLDKYELMEKEKIDARFAAERVSASVSALLLDMEESGSIYHIGQMITTEHARFHFMIMQKDAALMRICALSPMLSGCGATLRVMRPDSTTEYEVGFEMRVISHTLMGGADDTHE